GKRRIHRLVPARQSRQRQVELTLLVAIVELAVADHRVPLLAARKPCRTLLLHYLGDAAGDLPWVKLGGERNSRFGNASLLSRNVGEPCPKKLLMVERQIGDAGN